MSTLTAGPGRGQIEQPPTGAAATAAAAASPTWLKYVAMFTGVMAGLAGFLTVHSANLSNDAIYHGNQGVLHQAEASDSWAEYQANSIKARVVETHLDAGGVVAEAARAKLEAESKDLRDRQPPLKAKAQQAEHRRDDELSVSAGRVREKQTLDYAGMAAQVRIALASVAALTRRKEAFGLGILTGLAGFAITAYVMVNHYLPRT